MSTVHSVKLSILVLWKIGFLFGIFCQFDLHKGFFVEIEEGERDGKKPKATFTVEFFFHHFELQSGRVFLGGDQDEEANRTCHLCSYGQLDFSRRGREEKRLLKISCGTLHTIDQDEWKSNKREEQRRSNEASEKRAKIVKLV